MPRRSAAAHPDAAAGPVASVSAPDLGAPAADNAVSLARVALLGLDAEHISYTPEGVALMLSDGGDAGARTQSLTVFRGTHFTTCPVRALEDWLRASGCRYGPVFRKVDRWGNVEQRRLGPHALRLILRRRLAALPRGRASLAGGAGPAGGG